MYSGINENGLRHREPWFLWAGHSTMSPEPRNRRFSTRIVDSQFSNKKSVSLLEIGILWKCLEQLLPAPADHRAQAGRKGRGGDTDSSPSTFNTTLKPGLSWKKEVLSCIGLVWKGSSQRLVPPSLCAHSCAHMALSNVPGTLGENTPQILTSFECI